jgi:Mannosyltransferase putative
MNSLADAVGILDCALTYTKPPNPMTDGIYTLANDKVFDQMVALLNSIDTHASNLPVCVIAYNGSLDRVRAEIAKRPNVTLMDDPNIIARWRDFSTDVWMSHPTIMDTWKAKGIDGVYRLNFTHRYAAFDPEAPFERFIYLDADTLVLDSLDQMFQALDHHDFVTYDFQFKDPSHVFAMSSPKLLEIFPKERLQREIFCAGCYAAKRGLFAPEQRQWLVSKLAEGEAEVLYPKAPDQTVLNYMALRSGIDIYNLAVHLPLEQRTGNSVTSSHFEWRESLKDGKAEYILYDNGKRITYLHYIGLSSKLFTQLCQGENIHFPYRETFLHYRYLRDPENCPALLEKPAAPPSFARRILQKLGVG